MDVLTLLVLFLPFHPKNKLLGFQGNPKNGARMDLAGFHLSLPPTSASPAKSSLLLFVFTLVLNNNQNHPLKSAVQVVNAFQNLVSDETQTIRIFFVFFSLLLFLIMEPERDFVSTSINMKQRQFALRTHPTAWVVFLSVCDRFTEQICFDRQIRLGRGVMFSDCGGLHLGV